MSAGAIIGWVVLGCAMVVALVGSIACLVYFDDLPLLRKVDDSMRFNSNGEVSIPGSLRVGSNNKISSAGFETSKAMIDELTIKEQKLTMSGMTSGFLHAGSDGMVASKAKLDTSDIDGLAAFVQSHISTQQSTVHDFKNLGFFTYDDNTTPAVVTDSGIQPGVTFTKVGTEVRINVPKFTIKYPQNQQQASANGTLVKSNEIDMTSDDWPHLQPAKDIKIEKHSTYGCTYWMTYTAASTANNTAASPIQIYIEPDPAVTGVLQNNEFEVSGFMLTYTAMNFIDPKDPVTWGKEANSVEKWNVPTTTVVNKNYATTGVSVSFTLKQAPIANLTSADIISIIGGSMKANSFQMTDSRNYSFTFLPDTSGQGYSGPGHFSIKASALDLQGVPRIGDEKSPEFQVDTLIYVNFTATNPAGTGGSWNTSPNDNLVLLDLSNNADLDSKISFANTDLKIKQGTTDLTHGTQYQVSSVVKDASTNKWTFTFKFLNGHTAPNQVAHDVRIHKSVSDTHGNMLDLSATTIQKNY